MSSVPVLTTLTPLCRLVPRGSACKATRTICPLLVPSRISPWRSASTCTTAKRSPSLQLDLAQRPRQSGPHSVQLLLEAGSAFIGATVMVQLPRRRVSCC